MPPAGTTVGDWVRHVRLQRNETQATFGQRLGFSKETVRSVETRGARPSREFTTQLGRLIGVSAERAHDFDRFLRYATSIQPGAVPGWIAQLVAVEDEAPPGALPVPVTPLVDRLEDVATVLGRLRRRSTRLVALIGPPGIGKTRLALQAATEATDYSDGVHFVGLAPLTDPAEVTTAIATSLGLQVGDRPPPVSVLTRYLAPRELLLVIDNFEHVEAAAPVLGELLGATSKLKVLLTSRHAARIYGSHNFPVSPLGIAESIELFVQRAQAACFDFELTEETATAIRDICVRLEGIPLAIELAAALCRSFSPQALLARLQQPLAALVSGPTDRPPRQQTLRGAIDWSHRLLTPDEQTLFARLAVYAGGCPIEAMLEREPADETALRGDLDELVGKSLLRRQVSESGRPRYGMLEMVRQYGLEQLDVCGALETERRWHCTYFTRLAEHGTPARLQLERKNLQAARCWALERGEGRTVARLSEVLRHPAVPVA